MDDINMVPAGGAPQVFEPVPANAARLNITWSGSNGDLPDAVPYDASDADLKQMATEAVVNGDVPGIGADAGVDLNDFIVDRFNSTDEIPYARVFIRPKTPFGA
jgi:hypothetical protein